MVGVHAMLVEHPTGHGWEIAHARGVGDVLTELEDGEGGAAFVRHVALGAVRGHAAEGKAVAAPDAGDRISWAPGSPPESGIGPKRESSKPRAPSPVKAKGEHQRPQAK